MKATLLILTLLASSYAFAEAKKVAVVKLLRGEVDVLTLGKTSKLKVDDWVEDGAVIKTAEKSFAKLIFIDKSQMNVGPNSEMKIEKFSGDESGVIDLVKGKIRSQVTKDYLQMKDKDKSKLFIKTPNAVMGIRGTDFMISTNGTNTAAILFEGSVVFNKIESPGVVSTDKLEAMVNEGVRIAPGEFSVVDQSRSLPTVPSRLNIQQRESLEKNETFDNRAPSASASEEAKKSVVPNGLSGQAVSNDSSALKTEVAALGAAPAAPVVADTSNPNGYAKGDEVKPANGSFIHIESGIIIPPGSDSVLDPNTNTYIPGPSSGKVSADGSYVSPPGREITSSGDILQSVPGRNGAPDVIVKILPENPVKTEEPAKASDGGVPMTSSGMIVKAPSADSHFNPGQVPQGSGGFRPVTGGVPDVTQAVQQFNNVPRTRNIHVGD